MTLDLPNYDDLDLPDEITSGDDLVQSGVREFNNDGDQEYAYTLTAFIPKAPTPDVGIPAEAGYFIIPDINNAIIVTQVKLFKVSFIDKVPAPYNSLYLRVDRTNRPNPTEFQHKVWKQVVSNYQNAEGLANPSQVYLLPVLNRYKGEWRAQVGEFGVTAYNEVKKVNASTDDMTDGKINLGTRPIAVWKDGKKSVTARFDKGADVSVTEMIAQFKADLPDVRAYVKLRAVHTEKYLLDAWKRFKDGTVAEFNDELSPDQRFNDAVNSLKTSQLVAILKEHGHKVTIKTDRMDLIDLVNDHMEDLEAAVLMSASNEPPM